MACASMPGLRLMAGRHGKASVSPCVSNRYPPARAAQCRGTSRPHSVAFSSQSTPTSLRTNATRQASTAVRASDITRTQETQPRHPASFQTLAEGLAIPPERDPATSDKPTVISWVRLLDSCPCPECIHPSTRQKTRTSAESLRELRDVRAPVVTEASDTPNGQDGLRISWPSHTSFYSWDRLRRVARTSYPQSDYLQCELRRVLWDEKTLLKDSIQLRFRYNELHRGDQIHSGTLLKLLEQLQVFGLVVIEGVPHQETSDATCQLRRLAGWIGQIRDTFYGQTWNVKNMKNSKNVAYTNLNLGLHMDLLYFSSPPRFQLLHCLRNRVEGGSSYFVDSFRAAAALRATHPHSHRTLSEAAIDFEYDNDQHYLHYQHRVIQGDPYHLHSAVNWSPPFQGIMGNCAFGNSGGVANELDLYQALDDFETELNRPALCHEFQMREGDLVMFDNRRVLHARRAFRDRHAHEAGVEDGEPSRWLKGLYLDGEVVWDKLVTLNQQVRRPYIS